MLQRVQSLYLATVCIVMMCFSRVARPCSVLCTSKYASILFYCLLVGSCCVVVGAIYAIMRYDDRKLQMGLVRAIHLILTFLLLLTCLFMQQVDKCIDGCGVVSCMLIVYPCIALGAIALAKRRIEKDQRLVEDDRLR